jgi:hypothetical protein
MIPSLLVRNFRLFRNTALRKLGRVNLFVGRNSVGKSALLEAVQIYAAIGAPSLLLDLVSSRDGYWEMEIAEGNEVPQQFEHPFRSLFYGYHLPRPGEVGIEIGPLDENRVTIQTQLYRTITENEIARRVAIPPGMDNSSLVDAELTIEVRDNGRVAFLTPAAVDSEDLQRFRRRITASFSARDTKYNCLIVPAQNIPDNKLAAYWDKIHLTDFEKVVIDALKMIQPHTLGLAFVGEGSDRPVLGRIRRRVPIVRLDSSPERFPLRNLGDGMSRLLEIVLALVNARDGLLLVDEIENGVHWGVMPDLWRLVFRLAQSLNVQVFATTHSRDCIEGFARAWNEQDSVATFHRLDADDESGPIAVQYDLMTLSDAIKTEVEVR